MKKDNRPLSGEALSSDATYYGTESLPSKQKNQYEDWLTIQKTANNLSFEPLPYDSYFIAVIIVSITSSVIFGIMAVYILVLLLHEVEDYILKTNSAFLFYSASLK